MRLAKAWFDQVVDHVGQTKDQVGQGQGQELDNIAPFVSNLSMKQMQNICVNKLTHNNDIMKIPKV